MRLKRRSLGISRWCPSYQSLSRLPCAGSSLASNGISRYLGAYLDPTSKRGGVEYQAEDFCMSIFTTFSLTSKIAAFNT